jgi:hypothetical protein
MSNPVVLITGGLSGIGRAAAVAFAEKGAKVVVAGRRDDAGKALVKELRSLGSEAEFINADVRKDDDVRAPKAKLARSRTRPRKVTPRRVRHKCSRRDPEHETRSARHAKDRVAAALSTSPPRTGTRVRRVPPSTSAASTPSKASPSRWRSRSPSRASV